MKNILVLAVDYDGCFWPYACEFDEGTVIDNTRPYPCRINLTNPLVQHMIEQIIINDPDIVLVRSFSNRQHFTAEYTNCSRGTPSSFQMLEKLAKTLAALFPEKKIWLDKWLVVDNLGTTDENFAAPYTTQRESMWDRVTRQIKTAGFPRRGSDFQKGLLGYKTPLDEQKLLLFYLTIYRINQLFTTQDKVRVVCYDDRDDILKEIRDCFFKPSMRRLFPNFNINVFQYDPQTHPAALYSPQLFCEMPVLAGHHAINGEQWVNVHVALVQKHLALLTVQNIDRPTSEALCAKLKELHHSSKIKQLSHSNYVNTDPFVEVIASRMDLNEPVLFLLMFSTTQRMFARSTLPAHQEALYLCQLREPIMPLVSRAYLYECAASRPQPLPKGSLTKKIPEFQAKFIAQIQKMIAHPIVKWVLQQRQSGEFEPNGYGFFHFLKNVVAPYLPESTIYNLQFQSVFDYIFYRAENYLLYSLYVGRSSAESRIINELVYDFYHSCIFSIRTIIADLDLVRATADAPAVAPADAPDTKITSLYATAMANLAGESNTIGFHEARDRVIEMPQPSVITEKLSELIQWTNVKKSNFASNMTLASSLLENNLLVLCGTQFETNFDSSNTYHWLCMHLALSAWECQLITPPQEKISWIVDEFVPKMNINPFITRESFITSLQSFLKLDAQKRKFFSDWEANQFSEVNSTAQLKIVMTYCSKDGETPHSVTLAYCNQKQIAFERAHILLQASRTYRMDTFTLACCEWIDAMLQQNDTTEIPVCYQGINNIFSNADQKNKKIQQRKIWGNGKEIDRVIPNLFPDLLFFDLRINAHRKNASDLVTEIVTLILTEAVFPQSRVETDVAKNIAFSKLTEWGMLISGNGLSTSLIVRKPTHDNATYKLVYFNPGHELFLALQPTTEKTLGATIVTLNVNSEQRVPLEKSIEKFVARVILNRFLVHTERGLSIGRVEDDNIELTLLCPLRMAETASAAEPTRTPETLIQPPRSTVNGDEEFYGDL